MSSVRRGWLRAAIWLLPAASLAAALGTLTATSSCNDIETSGPGGSSGTGGTGGGSSTCVTCRAAINTEGAPNTNYCPSSADLHGALKSCICSGYQGVGGSGGGDVYPCNDLCTGVTDAIDNDCSVDVDLLCEGEWSACESDY